MLIVAPLFIPLLTALVLLLWRRPGLFRRAAAAGSAAGQLIVSLALVAQAAGGQTPIMAMAGWSAPQGIVLVGDLLAAIMVALSSLTALACLLFGFAEDRASREHPLRLPLVQFLVLGINLSFLTGDLFNLFVAFEVLLVASYALLTLEADDWNVRQAFPYLALNLFGSALFLCACGLAYALFGSLNMARIAERAPEYLGDARLTALAFLLLGVFGIKAGLFPLYYWLPNSYPILPASVAALYAGMLTKVGVYVLLRMFGTVLPHGLTAAHDALAWAAGLTMLFGVLGAVGRDFVRGILSFHILSQIGYMALAVGFLLSPPGSTLDPVYPAAACVLYIVHHIVVKSSLFMVGGAIMRLNGSDDLGRTGNLWRETPWLGVIFLVQAFSLAGLPPLSGFWGKLMIVVAGLERGAYVLVGLALLAGILTLFSMLKIWMAVFWRQDESVPLRRDDWRARAMTWICGGLAAISLAIGLNPQPMVDLATRAARDALDQPAYIARVLGLPRAASRDEVGDLSGLEAPR